MKNLAFFKKIVLCCFYFLMLWGCQQSQNPSLKTAKDFLDHYYIMANQTAALPLTVGQAKEKLQKELELVQNVNQQSNAHRSRHVDFKLTKEGEKDGNTFFVFELTIKIPDLDTMKKSVFILVDPKQNKITQFSEF